MWGFSFFTKNTQNDSKIKEQYLFLVHIRDKSTNFHQIRLRSDLKFKCVCCYCVCVRSSSVAVLPGCSPSPEPPSGPAAPPPHTHLENTHTHSSETSSSPELHRVTAVELLSVWLHLKRIRAVNRCFQMFPPSLTLIWGVGSTFCSCIFTVTSCRRNLNPSVCWWTGTSREPFYKNI